MPIEIKELVIRAIVDETKDEAPSARAEASAPSDRSALVEECVREVLKILERTRER
ncbi:MAG TPA: DUF5908 family protein [Verrucomicrobiota bacterium]|nr:DUF5908 family protein [Verrucomicrobiota bacterium]